MKFIKKIFFLILFLLLNSCYSQTQHPIVINTTHIDSLNNFVLESLKSKRIVMLGDAIHGHGYFKKIVINQLNEWLDNIEKNPADKSIPQKLFLFLEKDSLSLFFANQVINKGDFENYLTWQIDITEKFGGWDQNSVDNVEFLFELRDIKERISELNRNTTQDISLLIEGVETPPSFFNFSTMYQLGDEKYREKLFLWFTKERDELVAANINQIMEEHKEYKALVFYGTAHLIRKHIDKSPWSFSNTQEPVYGYFLAHYLDEYFGRDQVEVYYTAKVHGEGTNVIKKLEKNDEHNDYYIMCNVLPDFPFSLYLINNNTILSSLVSLTDKYIEGIKEEDYLHFVHFSRMFFYHLRRSYLYSEKSYMEKIDSLAKYPLQFTKKDIKYIYKTTRRISKELINIFDIVKNIEKMDKWIMMIDEQGDKTLYVAMLKTIIYNLPREIPEETFYSNLDVSYRSNFLSQFEIDQINSRLNELKIYYAVTSMWINTKEENEKINKYLQRTTGLNYTTTKDWSDWWRKKYVVKSSE